jgi:hypothetical protein
VPLGGKIYSDKKEKKREMFDRLSAQDKENYTNFIKELHVLFKKYKTSLDNAELIDNSKGFVGFIECNYDATELVADDIVVVSVEKDN